MTPGEVLQIGQDALWVILKIGVPMMLAALSIGLIVSFIQALTQIQEMTLSFVPKIVGIFALLVVLLPYFGSVLNSFTLQIFDKPSPPSPPPELRLPVDRVRTVRNLIIVRLRASCSACHVRPWPCRTGWTLAHCTW